MYLCMRYSQYINKEFVNCQLEIYQFSVRKFSILNCQTKVIVRER